VNSLNADNRLFRYKRDPNLSLRLIFCFIALSALYAIFIGVLTYLGVGFIPITIMVSAMLLAQWYFSDKMVLWFLEPRLFLRAISQLHEIVERLVQRSNLPKPKIAVVNTRMQMHLLQVKVTKVLLYCNNRFDGYFRL
jgi:heat shock protein HtpX